MLWQTKRKPHRPAFTKEKLKLEAKKEAIMNKYMWKK